MDWISTDADFMHCYTVAYDPEKNICLSKWFLPWTMI